MTDNYGKNINYSDFFMVKLKNYHYNNFNNTMINWEELKMISCDKSEYLDPEFIKSYKPAEWMCFDSAQYTKNPIKFGGGFDTEIISNIFLQINTCSDEKFKNDSISSGRCKSALFIK